MRKTGNFSFKKIQTGILVGVLLLALGARAQTSPLVAGDPILLPDTHDGYDFIRIDNTGKRLLLGHEGNKSFDVFDLATQKLLKVIPTSTAQDAAVDDKRHSYYVSGNDPARMVIVDSKTLEITGTVPTGANTDLIGYNPNTGLVYECNDTAAEVWVIDPAAKKIVTTIKLDGTGVEDMAFDPDYKHLYQAVKGKNTIAVIDPASNKVTDVWPLAPDKGPHGIAVVPERNGLVVGCAGKLVLFDRTTGKITSTIAIGEHVDEITYDPTTHFAYCASRVGKMSVIMVEPGKLTSIGEAADEPGTGDIVVDPKTHVIWIAYKKGTQCFLQPFMPAT